MMNFVLEILFWLTLLIYIGIRLTQTKKVINSNLKGIPQKILRNMQIDLTDLKSYAIKNINLIKIL